MRCSVVPIISSLLTITFYSSVIMTLVHNNTKHSVSSWCYNQVGYIHMSHTIWMWHFIASSLFALAKSSRKAVLVSVACVTNHICVIICVPSGLCMLTVWAVCNMSKEKCGDSKKENTQWCVVPTIVVENTSFSLLSRALVLGWMATFWSANSI